MLANDRHRAEKQQVGALMASPTWAYLTEDDHHHILKVATLVCRRPDGRSELVIDWKGYLAAIQRRIAIRRYERKTAGRAA